MEINRKIARLGWSSMLFWIFIVTLILTAVFLSQLSGVVGREVSLSAARRDAESVADSAFQAMYSRMREGWSKADINKMVQGLNASTPGINISVHRGAAVSKQFGAASRPVSDLAARAMKTGVDGILMDGQTLHLARVVRATAECLPCHTQSSEGAIQGVVEIFYPMDRITGVVDSIHAGLFFGVTALLLAILVISYWCVYQFIVRPMRKLSSGIIDSSKSFKPITMPAYAPSDIVDMVDVINLSFHDVRLARDRSELAKTIFDHSQDGILVSDRENKIVAVNKVFEEVTGYSESELIGKSPKIFASGYHDGQFYAGMWDALHAKGSWSGLIHDKKKDGAIYRKWLKINVLMGENGDIKNFISFHEDNTEREGVEARVLYLAHYDVLTELPNRALLAERLEQGVLAATRDKTPLAVLFIDLDRFKFVNDTMGHGAGDALLKIVSGRLLACVREADTVARLGGDEFAILLKNAELSGVERVANSILASVAEPCIIDGARVQTHASIGIALRDSDQGAEELVRRADVAMYCAKGAGKDTFRFYTDRMSCEEGATFALEADIEEGMRAKQFFVEYQPQFDSSGQICGVEALARWRHPKFGLVAPVEFIKAAEESGHIGVLGQFILSEALSEVRRWGVNANGDAISLSVNASPLQLVRGDFAESVARLLRQYGVAPDRLHIEITESALIDRAGDAVQTMIALRNIGVGVEIDDFGTGYSSLSYLKVIPATGIKLDRSFVLDIGQAHERIVSMIVDIAKHLELNIVAEGVETGEQAEYLSGIGCDLIQGYYFSRPVGADAMSAMIDRARKDGWTPLRRWPVLP